MAPIYSSLYSELLPRTILESIPHLRLSSLKPQHRAIAMVLILIGVTSGLGAISALTPHAYTPMILLGVFYGIMLSYPVITFLSPTIQSAAGGFLGGITVSSVATKLTAAKTWLGSVGGAIASLVAALPLPMNPVMSVAVTYCIWMTLSTTLLVVLVNLYFAHDRSSNIGQQITPPVVQKPNADSGDQGKAASFGTGH